MPNDTQRRPITESLEVDEILCDVGVGRVVAVSQEMRLHTWLLRGEVFGHQNRASHKHARMAAVVANANV